MIKQLTAIGGSLGFIIDKPIAELYKLDKNTQIEVTPKEDGINIRFIKEKSNLSSDEALLKMAEDINSRYNNMMKNLAK